MIRHVGIGERIDVHEPEGGEKRPDEEKRGREGGAPALTDEEEDRQQRDDHGRIEELDGVPGVDSPVRVDEGEAGRPEDLSQIKQDDPTGDEDAAGPRQVEGGAGRADVDAFDMGGRPDLVIAPRTSQGKSGIPSARLERRPFFHQRTTRIAAGKRGRHRLGGDGQGKEQGREG